MSARTKTNADIVGYQENLFAEKEKFEPHKNSIGRSNPSRMPATLARSSAFAPKSRNLNTDSNFHRLYIVDNESIIEVQGRELGYQHRDLCFAIFREEPTVFEIPNPRYEFYENGLPVNASLPETIELCEVAMTWHELLVARNLTPQTNNKKTILRLLQDMQKVLIVDHEGTPEEVIEKFKQGKISDYGRSQNIFYDISWSGTGLNDKVYIKFGPSIRETFRNKRLVSCNADVQYKLKKGFSKSIWAHIDGRPHFTWIDESRICNLLGIDIWDEDWDAEDRKRHREDVRETFKDMAQAGGILPRFTEKVTGAGKRKERRYFYTHALNFDAQQAPSQPLQIDGDAR